MARQADTSDPPSQRGLYGWCQSVWLVLCLLNTRLWFPGCRLVRLPIFLRGRRRIQFGAGFVCGYMVRLDAFGGPGCISFGKEVQLNDFVHIGALQQVSIGDEVLIASRVFISDHDHGIYGGAGPASSPEQPPKDRVVAARPVRIGNRVWIGEGVSILSGVSIGDGAVIGAGAVVTDDIPAGCIAVGVPARVVRRYSAVEATWLPVPR